MARLLSTTAVLGLALLMACPAGRRGGGGGGDGGGGDDDSGDSDDDDATDDDDGTGGGPVDILLVIDNSNSMTEIQGELQNAFPSLIDGLLNAGVEFQLGVTTTDIENAGNGNQGNIRSLGGIGIATCGEPELLVPGSPNLTSTFTDLVNVGDQGAGNETGMLAAALALCKAQDATFWGGLSVRPDTDPVKIVCGLIPADQQRCNEGFVRAGAIPVIITVSDEGDDTYRSSLLPPPNVVEECVSKHSADPTFGECDCRIEWWIDLFSDLAPGTVFLNIGPTYQSNDQEIQWCDGTTVRFPGPCNGFGGSVCSIDFYQQTACLTGGLFFPVESTSIDNDPSTCTLSDFGPIAADIGAFLGG